MSNRTCTFGSCELPLHCKGFCRIHYKRFRIHGDPSVDLHKAQRTAGGLKICKGCGDPKEDSEFHKDSGSPDGLRSQCKPCRNAKVAKYHWDNRDARLAYERKRRSESGDRVRANDRARYERDKDKRVALASDGVRLRRARMAGIESDPKVTVPNLREMLGDNCCYCGVEMSFARRPRGAGIAPNRATLEHVLPISRGGTHTLDNTVLACHRCNVSKNDKTLEEYEAWKGVGLLGWKEATPSGACGN